MRKSYAAVCAPPLALALFLALILLLFVALAALLAPVAAAGAWRAPIQASTLGNLGPCTGLGGIEGYKRYRGFAWIA